MISDSLDAHVSLCIIANVHRPIQTEKPQLSEFRSNYRHSGSHPENLPFSKQREFTKISFLGRTHVNRLKVLIGYRAM